MNSTSNSTQARAINWTGLPDGLYTFNVSVRDYANRENVTLSRIVRVDSGMPVPSYVTGSDSNGSYVGRNFIIANISVIEVNLNTTNVSLMNASGAILRSNLTVANQSFYINFTGLDDGMYFVNSTSIDFAGNKNSTETRTVVIDTIVPVPSYVTGSDANGSYVGRNFIIANISVIEVNLNTTNVSLMNASGAILRSNLTVANQSFYINFTGLDDGMYFVNATVNDSAGNRNISFGTRTVVIDTSVPVPSFISPSDTNGGNLSRGYVLANVSVSDINLQEIIIRLFNSTRAEVNTSSSSSSPLFANFTGLAEGTYYLNATANDSAGNKNYTETRTLQIEISPPLVSIASPQNVTYNYNISIPFNFSVSDAGSGIGSCWYAVDIEDNVSIACGQNTTLNVSQGSHTLRIYANDTAGNVNGSTRVTFFVDSLIPLIDFGSLTPANGSAFSSNSLFVNVSVTESNFANITFELYNNSNGATLVNRTTYTSAVYSVNWTALNESVYYFNASISDTIGNINRTLTRTVTFDRTAPVLNWSSASDAKPAGRVNFTLNASDTLSGLQGAFIEIQMPNGTRINRTMTLAGNSFNATLAEFRALGDYDINFSANDSAGNILKTGESFEIYIPLNLSGNVSNAKGSLRNYTYKFFRPGTNLTLYNFSGQQYNLTNEIRQRVYDIEVEASSHIVKLEGFNFSGRSEIPVDIDTFNQSGVVNITNYKILSAMGVNTTFTGNATLNLSYNGAYNLDTSAVTEDNLTIQKCSDWNYLDRICDGEYTIISEREISTGEDRINLNVSSFSAYLVSEFTCGNNICQATFGETSSTCVTDCPVSSGSGSSSGSNGGGGSSGGGVASTIIGDVAKLQISFIRLEREINVGQNITENLIVSNTGSGTAKIKVKYDNILKDIVFINSEIEVSPQSSVNVPIKVEGKKEGAYVGNIYITSSSYNQTIPTVILVKGKTDKLMDLKLFLEKKSFYPEESLRFTVDAYNLGQLRRYDIILGYDLIQDYTNTSVYHKEETMAIETSLSFTREIELSSDIPLGRYTLVTKATYDNVSAIATAPLIIQREFVLPVFIKEYLPVIVSSLVLVIVMVLGGYYFVSIRRRLFQKKMEEKQKNSIYPFPDFYALPKSKYAYIGMVADSDVKTYLDHTQLNRHTLIAGGTGSGKTVSGMVVVEELLKKGVGVVVFDPVGQWTGFARKNEDKAMRALYRKFRIGGAAAFRPVIIEINEKTSSLNILHYMNRKGLTILRLDGLTPKKADEFIEQSLDKVYRANLSEVGELKSLLVLDEVHRLLPKYGGHKAYLKLEQAVREFRKWGIGLLMISQVLTDFKGAIRGNIGTEIQLHSKYEGDIKRVRERHGSALSKLISKMPVGVGMIESGGYNKGSPYFVEFRPILHSPYKLNEKEIKLLERKEAPVLVKKSEQDRLEHAVVHERDKEDHHNHSEPAHHGRLHHRGSKSYHGEHRKSRRKR